MLAIASDHAGFDLKQYLTGQLKSNNIDIKDFGCFSTASVDYPDFALALCKSIQSGECDQGILICGTGIGMSIAANKCRGIRAALCHCTEYARLSREHNNSNVLVLGARFTDGKTAEEIVDMWLKTQFVDKRHQSRLDKITNIEEVTWQTIQSMP